MTQLSKRIIFNARIKGVSEDQKKFDFYETPAWGTELMLEHMRLEPNSVILEPCNGLSSISNILKEQGHKVTTLDIDEKAEADHHIDFLQFSTKNSFDHVITNPPFIGNYNWEFVRKALEIVKRGGVCHYAWSYHQA